MRRMAFRRGLLVALAWAAAGCAASSASRGWARDPMSAELARWVAEHPLAAGENIRVDELERSAWTSQHVVQIREVEPLHVHASHDLQVMLHRGHGVFHLGQEVWRVEPGSLMQIPHGVPHAFVNCSAEPAVAFVKITPPFDDQDVVIVQDVPSPRSGLGEQPPRCTMTGLAPLPP